MATNTADAPAYKTVMHTFWGKELPHIVVGVDDVRVVIQDAVKVFSGITNPSNLSTKLKDIMHPYQNGSVGEDAGLDRSHVLAFHKHGTQNRINKSMHHAANHAFVESFLIKHFPRSVLVQRQVNETLRDVTDLRGMLQEREVEIAAANDRIGELERLTASIESTADVEARLESANVRLAQLQQAELVAEDAMCFAQLEQLFRRVRVPMRTREQLAALYLGQYAEVRAHFAGKVRVTCAQMVVWLKEHPVGKLFWMRLALRCGLPVASFDSTLYQIEHIQNAAWAGADHFFNFMILFAPINNSVEFRTGPCHLKMIALGRRQFEYVQRFARWHMETKSIVARSAFAAVDDTLNSVSLLGGVQQVSIMSMCGKKRKSINDV